MEQFEAKSLSEFTEVVAALAAQAPDERLWYRGCGSWANMLVPTLFRHPTLCGASDLLALETRLLTRFKQRAVPYLGRHALRDDPWEHLFMMQHYGVPTRLLDWSENAYIALWFALSGEPNRADAVVWILNPARWNRQVLAHQSYDRDVLSTGDRQLQGYAPGAPLVDMNRTPVALYGTHNSPRIVAQRGVFTIAGKDTAPLDSFEQQFGDSTGCLATITVLEPDQQRLLDETRAAGFTESMMYPDLEGLARELKTSEGF